jgi:hypothetical protein
VALLAILCVAPSKAVKGIDISTCSTVTLSELQCMVGQGYQYIIFQAWRGGLGMVGRIATCVDMAYQAGFKYVDVYVYLCPECSGNNPPTNMANSLANLGLNVNYFWLDVEPCGSNGGCWTNANTNGAFLQSGGTNNNFRFWHILLDFTF